jgi:hypothetical protein
MEVQDGKQGGTSIISNGYSRGSMVCMLGKNTDSRARMSV